MSLVNGHSDPGPANHTLAFPKPPTPNLTPPQIPSPLPLTDPPPPYPTRRSRTGTTRSTRRAAQISSDGTVVSVNVDPDTLSPMDDGDENTPLLLRSRQRTVSHSTVISAHSIAHNVISLFQSESEPEIAVAQDEEAVHSAVNAPFSRRLRRYFRPMWKAEYYGPLFHLVLVNFPYALMAFLCLFVGTLTGTTLLIALPLGAVICWFNLIGARAFARGELALQAHFHGPLTIQTPNPPMPIFTRRVIGDPSQSGNESGQQEAVNESSFLRNTYAMFTDPTSYQALFYFLVIKPSITLFLTLALWVAVPISFALIIPAPAALRAISRIGVWQATIAVEGLSRPRL